MIRRVELVVEVHDPHQLVFGLQKACEIHGFLDFKRLVQLVVGKVVAGNGIPVLALFRLALDEHFKDFREFRLLAGIVVEEDEQVIELLVELRAIFTAHFFGVANGFLEVVDALVKHCQLPLLATVRLSASGLPFLHVVEGGLGVLELQVDLRDVVIGLGDIGRRDVALGDRIEQILDGALTVALLDLDVRRNADDRAFFVAVQRHAAQLVQLRERRIEILVGDRCLLGFEVQLARFRAELCLGAAGLGKRGACTHEAEHTRCNCAFEENFKLHNSLS